MLTTEEKDEVLAFIQGLRDSGVTGFEAKFPNGLELKGHINPRGANELPTSQAERERLLADPKTPEDVKRRIAEEDEMDLEAAS